MQLFILIGLLAFIIGLFFLDQLLQNLDRAMSVTCPFCAYSDVREMRLHKMGDRTPRMWGFYLGLALSKPSFHCPKCEKDFGIGELNRDDQSSIETAQTKIKWILGALSALVGLGILAILFLNS